MKISIITPALNAERFIPRALESIQSQTFHGSIEHIVMDGGSQDKTVSISKKYNNVQVYSEKDEGIYDGINQGIQISSGDIIGFLNSDDILSPDCLNIVQHYFSKYNIDILTGSCSFIDENENYIFNRITPTKNPHQKGILFGVPAINARFFKKEAFLKVGMFDKNFRLAADRHWLLRSLNYDLSYRFTEELFYLYRFHKNSSTISGSIESKIKIYEEHRKLFYFALSGRDFSKPADNLSNLTAWRFIEQLKFEIQTSKSIYKRFFLIIKEMARNPVLLFTSVLSWRRYRARHSDS